MQALHVADHRLVDDAADVSVEPEAFVLEQRLHHSDHTLHQFRQVHFLFRQQNLAAFDLGHVKHFVDQVNQEFRRYIDLLETVHHPFRVVYVLFADLGHAQNRVHRRSNIVAHPRQEI